MNIYCNFNYDIDTSDYPCDLHNENIIYCLDGIYKQYKKHFFKVKLNEKDKDKIIQYKSKEFIIENLEQELDKTQLLTYIPYENYFVKRQIEKYILDDGIIYCREMDNNIYEKSYFIVDNYDLSIFEKLCSIIYKNV